MLAAAAQMPDVPFKVAGDGPALSEMKAKAPHNVEFVGRLGPDELKRILSTDPGCVVVPSVWFEQFPMVVLEAMGRALPVIGSRIGGLPEIIEEGLTGSLFEPGNAEDLARQVRRLWEDPQLCRRMGIAGRQKAMREYTEDAYFHNLMAVYQAAIQRSRSGVGAHSSFVPGSKPNPRRIRIEVIMHNKMNILGINMDCLSYGEMHRIFKKLAFRQGIAVPLPGVDQCQLLRLRSLRLPAHRSL